MATVQKPKPGTPESHQAWINDPRSGQGGMEKYVATQNQKYTDAALQNNADILNRLNADAQRVGYSLGTTKIEKKPEEPKIIATTGTNSIAASYIESLNNSKRDAIMAQLDKSRQGALSGLAEERAGVKPRYSDTRNQVAAGSQLAAKNFAEFMSQRGGVRSGANVQAEISRAGTLQNNLGSLNRQEQQTYDGLDRRTSDLNSAYEQDRLSAVSGLEADRMGSLLNQFNSDRQFGLQQQQFGLQQQGQNFNQGMANKQFDYGVGRDSVLDNRYNQQLERSNFESDRQFEMAKGQQEWSNAFQQGQFDFTKAQTAWDNTFKNKSFQQSMSEAAAGRGLQWASLNQRDKEFVAQEAWNREQFDYTKTQDTIENEFTRLGLESKTQPQVNESMKEALNLALKDPSYLSAKDDAAKKSIVDSYYSQLSGGMSDDEISQYLK